MTTSTAPAASAAPVATSATPSSASDVSKPAVSKPAATRAAKKTAKATAQKPNKPATNSSPAPTATVAKTSPHQYSNNDKPFENARANNPIASQAPVKKTLEEKIRELAEKSQAKKAAQAKPKQSAVLNPNDERVGDQIKDVSAIASPKVKTKEQESDVVSAPEEQTEGTTETGESTPVSEFESLNGTTNEEVLDEVDGQEEPWEPNFSIRSMKFDENGNAVDFETEIPEKFRGLITDKESEAELKKIFSAANGIDYVQARRDQYRAQKEQYEKYIGQVQERLSGVDEMIQAGDLETAFKTMAIPEEKVLQWVLDKIEYSKLEPGQRQLIDSQRASEKRAKALEMENKSMFQSQMQTMAQNKAIALDAIMERPDLKAVIEAYDSRPGKKPQDPTFRDLVINHGELTWHRSRGKIDASPIESVEAVLRDMGIEQGYRPAQSTAPTMARTQQNPASPARQTQAKPAQSLPNVASRAASPTTPRITTKAQLMERRKQILGI